MDTLRKDIVFALRAMARSPGITLAAVVCLALGLGATTTTYSILRELVLRPVPVSDDARIVRVTELPPNAPADADGAAPATVLDWQRRIDAFDGVAAYVAVETNVTGTAEPERVVGIRVTGRFFELLGARPLLGRVLSPADEAAGNDRLVVLSESLWRRRFGADTTVIGRTVRLNGEPVDVVGVMAREFIFPPGGELWMPLVFTPAAAAQRSPDAYSVLARLREGASIEEAGAEVALLERQIARAYPEARGDWSARVEPIQDYYARNPRPYMIMMMSSVVIVLLIACANVANLLLARATVRNREVAMRMTLGAGRGRIVRQFLTESLVLAFVAAVAGVLVALWGAWIFRNSLPAELVRFNPGWTRIGVNLPVLGFTTLIASATGVLFGLVPAVQVSRTDLQAVLRDGGRGATASPARHRLRGALVVGEVALAFMLMVATGVVLRGFLDLLRADPGFRTEHILSFQLTLPRENYGSDARVAGFHSRLGDRLATLPEVRGVAMSSVLPMDYDDSMTRIRTAGRPDAKESDLPIVRLRAVSDGYFSTMGIQLLSGRGFERSDGADAESIAVVSDLFARRFWPGREPVGQRVRLIGDTTWRRVVGVVADVRHNPNSGGAGIEPMLHVPLRQRPARSVAVLLRTAGDPLELAASVRAAISALDPALAPGEVRTLERVVHNAFAPQRATAGMLATFGVIALVLAAVGIFGVMSYSVRQRADEIGVRLALGARAGDVIAMVLRQGAVLVAAGVALGMAGGIALARAMSGLVFGVNPADPLVLGASILIIGAMSLLACWLPARRAASGDPVQLLR